MPEDLLLTSLFSLGLLLVLAKSFEEGFRRLGLVGFVGSILAGIIVGPGVLSIISNTQYITLFTSLGINFLLFLAGAEEFSLPRLRGRMRLRVLVGSIAALGIPLLLVYILLPHLIGGSNLNYLALSVILGMSSAGPLAKLLMEAGVSRTNTGTFVFITTALVEIGGVVIFATSVSFSPVPLTIAEIIAAVGISLLLGNLVFARALEVAEVRLNAREIVFSLIVALVLLSGYLGQLLKFNAGIVALFLGFVAQKYFKERPEMLERLHAFTYGFFEPLFFSGIGLYFVRVTPLLLYLSLGLATLILVTKGLGGFLASKMVGVDPWYGSWGISSKGGVDSALLFSALTLGVIGRSAYSYAAIAIAISGLVSPLLFKAKIRKISQGNVTPIRRAMRIGDILKELGSFYTDSNQVLRHVIETMTSANLRAMVVVDGENRPIGYVSVHDLLEIDPASYGEMRVQDIQLHEVRTVYPNSKVSEILRIFRETETPIIGVIDYEGKLLGTIVERSLLRLLTNSV
jgi:Kef-type K+ transport system membrane component KefB/CBS domain-containing protein